MAKRGRPRKTPTPEPMADGGSNIAIHEKPDYESRYDDPAPMSIYDQEYRGRRWWLVGVKRDTERGVPPFHANHFGLIEFTLGTQRQIPTDDGYLGLDGHRRRIYPVRIPYSYISRAVLQVRNSYVRWQRRVRDDGKGRTDYVWAASVMNSMTRHKVQDPKTRQWVPGDEALHPMMPGDVPVSQYLVLLPKVRVSELGMKLDEYQEFDINQAPSMLDLDSDLRPEKNDAWFSDDDDSDPDEGQ